MIFIILLSLVNVPDQIYAVQTVPAVPTVSIVPTPTSFLPRVAGEPPGGGLNRWNGAKRWNCWNHKVIEQNSFVMRRIPQRLVLPRRRRPRRNVSLAEPIAALVAELHVRR